MLNELTNKVLSALLVYGLPLLFGIVLISSVGVPLPCTLLLLTAGTFAAQGHFSLLWVELLALLAAVAGDHLAYLTGWLAGRRAMAWLGRLLRRVSLRRARSQMQQRGWGAVFFSRWLLTPLNAPCSLVCGSIGYPLHAFFTADLIGEAIYVSVLIMLGYWFGDQLSSITNLLGIVVPILLVIAGVVWGGPALWRRLCAVKQTVA